MTQKNERKSREGKTRLLSSSVSYISLLTNELVWGECVSVGNVIDLLSNIKRKISGNIFCQKRPGFAVSQRRN